MAAFKPHRQIYRYCQTNLAPPEVHIAYTYTALSSSGNRFIDGFSEADFLTAVRFWEKAINHYLTLGEKLKRIEAN